MYNSSLLCRGETDKSKDQAQKQHYFSRIGPVIVFNQAVKFSMQFFFEIFIMKVFNPYKILLLVMLS